MPASIPAEVEHLAQGIRESNPDYSEAQVWGTAWSVYCKNIEPGSPHCTRDPSAYLTGNPGPAPREGAVVKREKHGPSIFELVYLGEVEDGDDGWHSFALFQDRDEDAVLVVSWPNSEGREVWDHMARTWIMYWLSHTS